MASIFDFNQEKSFENADKLKQQLVSEIDVIRDTMVVVNMFLTESFLAAATLFQELQDNKQNNNSDENSSQH
ncbi:hypothetical protein LAG90_10535 [Marinilongibacter aquaticus]|uniref:hypothetical protein n=1 Tax=Marinilongibacter aquaticus TaxID=2975157 RepID=UPI0021BD19CF|nr:hypothetical protein [Marinilongibacter aquaticus]UBM57257.1 hypothetical protein LAG90_10535 [Marinilongibacter aquaticus]